ncbi:hypothetical protein NBRC116589_23970 [Ruegeria sp. HU-ET01832]
MDRPKVSYGIDEFACLSAGHDISSYQEFFLKPGSGKLSQIVSGFLDEFRDISLRWLLRKGRTRQVVAFI